MTCQSKGGLAKDRRVSISFRDNCLETIFRHNIEFMDDMVRKIDD